VLHGYTHFTTGDGPVLSYTLNPPPGVWYHLAFTADNAAGIQALYVNGVAVASQNISGAIDYDTHPTLVGADLSANNLAYVFSGRIDEASLYNRALTPQEIQSVYQAGSQGKCATPVIVPAALTAATTNVPYSQPFSLAHASPPFSFSNPGANLPPGMTLQSDGSFFGVPTTVGAFTFSVRALDGLGQTPQTNLTLKVLPCVQAPPGMLAWWRGESNALDQVGQHNGALNGGVSFVPGYDGYAFRFDGQSGYVDVGAWSPGTRWTVEAWVNPSVNPSGRHAIVAGYQSCLDWGIALQDGQFVATIRQPGGCSLPIPSGIYPQVGLWYHVAETVDGTNAVVYVNGIPRGTNAVEPNYIGTPAGTRIGGSVCCGEYF